MALPAVQTYAQIKNTQPRVATRQENPMLGRGGSANPANTRPPGNSTNSAWMPQSGVSPFDAASGATGIGDFQRFSDNAYNESVRRLTPQVDTAKRSFDQDMVNRGLSAGTQAYDDAYSNFTQGTNDAFAGARADADAQGLAAQNQSFTQGATSSNLLNQLLQAQMGADASRFGSSTAAAANRYATDAGAFDAAGRLRLANDSLDMNGLLDMIRLGQSGYGLNTDSMRNNYDMTNANFNQNMGIVGNRPGAGGFAGSGLSDYYSGQQGQNNINQANSQARRNANTSAAVGLAGALFGGG